MASRAKSPSTIRATSFSSPRPDPTIQKDTVMKTVSRVYDTYAQARDAVAAVEASGVPTDDLSVVANKYVREKYADVHEVPAPPAYAAGGGGSLSGGAGRSAGRAFMA